MSRRWRSCTPQLWGVDHEVGGGFQGIAIGVISDSFVCGIEEAR